MDMSCECSSCSQCCHVNSLFWVHMLGIAGAFVSLFFFFWQYPGTLTKFVGPSGDDYQFVSNGTDLLIYKDRLLVSGPVPLSSSDIVDDLRHAHCRGTSLLWTMLVGGFLGAMLLFSLMINAPSRFICCNFQQSAVPPKPMPPVPMPIINAQASTTTTTSGTSPASAATTTATTGAKLA
jgi:hypothetical protein